MQAQAEQHAQQAEMHVHLLQEANAQLAAEQGDLLQRAVTAERALGSEREALVHRALTAEQATCALMEQHARDAAASSEHHVTPVVGDSELLPLTQPASLCMAVETTGC